MLYALERAGRETSRLRPGGSRPLIGAGDGCTFAYWATALPWRMATQADRGFEAFALCPAEPAAARAEPVGQFQEETRQGKRPPPAFDGGDALR